MPDLADGERSRCKVPANHPIHSKTPAVSTVVVAPRGAINRCRSNGAPANISANSVAMPRRKPDSARRRHSDPSRRWANRTRRRFCSRKPGTPDLDPTTWWISEKLDGVRAYWDGQQFLSAWAIACTRRIGFTVGLPNSRSRWRTLGRAQTLSATVSIVRRQDQPETWNTVRYVVFDAPTAAGGFEQRQAALRRPCCPPQLMPSRSNKSPAPALNICKRNSPALRHSAVRG